MIQINQLGLLVVTAAITFVPAAARAQTNAQDVPAAPGVGWTFTPSVTLGALHDSNVALRSAPASVASEGDTVFTLDPSGSVRYSGKYTEFSGVYHGRFRRYMELGQLNGFEQRGNLGLQYRASPHVTVFARNAFAAVPTTDEIDFGGVPYTRTGSRSDRAAAGLAAQLSSQTTLSGRYDFTWVDFDRPELAGGVIHGASSDLTRAMSSRFRVGGEAAVRLANLQDGARRLRFVDVGGRLGYDLTAHTQFSLAGGLALLTDQTLGRSDTGPYVRGSLATVSEHAVVGTSFERSFIPAFGFGGSARSQQLRGWVDLPRVAPRTYVQLSGTWRRTNPLEARSVRLDTLQLRGSLGYALARQASVQGYYAFTRQDSIVTGGEVSRSRIGAELVLSQPMRIR